MTNSTANPYERIKSLIEDADDKEDTASEVIASIIDTFVNIPGVEEAILINMPRDWDPTLEATNIIASNLTDFTTSSLVWQYLAWLLMSKVES